MELLLRELNSFKCIEYLKGRLDKMLYFSNAISHLLNFGNGKFYTIIPKGANEQYLYDFEIGGRVYPYKREEGEFIKQVINHSENIIKTSLHEYVTTSKSHGICLEDYSSDPAFEYMINSNRQYHLIDNRVFYLIDNTFTFEEMKTYFNWAGGFGFLCALLNIPDGLRSLGLKPRTTLNDSSKKAILNSINTFFIETYHEESYLIWIDDKEGSDFLDLLHKGIDALNT